MAGDFHSGRVAMLVAGIGAALATAFSMAPAASAEAGPMPRAWTVQPSPDPPGALASALQAVSCSRRGSCLAVGWPSYSSITMAVTLIGALLAAIMVDRIGRTETMAFAIAAIGCGAAAALLLPARRGPTA